MSLAEGDELRSRELAAYSSPSTRAIAPGLATPLPLSASHQGVYARLRRAMESVEVRARFRKLKLATQRLRKDPLIRNLRDERANSDLSPQAGRGEDGGRTPCPQSGGEREGGEATCDCPPLAGGHGDGATTAAPAGTALSPRTRILVEAPIAATLVRLAAPNVLVMVAQASVGLIETYFVGRLGTDALAGVSLVFPAVMLMQMMSAGAMGGGISSAIARALGAGRRADADALVLHALAIAVVFGLAFMVALLGGGRWLYGAMGGGGPALDAALTYSNVVFSGAVLLWIYNSLANVVRGTGNMAVPAIVTCAGVAALIPLSPCLILGWGPFPALGVAGGAVAVVAFYFAGSVALAGYLWSGRSVVRVRFKGAAFRWPLFYDILKVGVVAALITVQTNLTIAIATGLVGRFGSGAIAGYGTGSRLEYLLIPLVFGLGGPLVALVGTNIGAGRRERAIRAAWIGAAIAAGLCELIGLCAAVFPLAWLSLFDSDPAMLDAGTRYLHRVGPVYGVFGLGMALYFASQGAGRLLWPWLANMGRLVVAAGGGWLALRFGGDLSDIFLALAMALGVFGTVNAVAIAGGAWFTRPNRSLQPI